MKAGDEASPSNFQEANSGRPLNVRKEVRELGLAQLTDSLEDVFWICSVDRRELYYCSKSATRVWGRDAAILYRNTGAFFESIHPEDRRHVVSQLRKQTSGTICDQCRYEYRIFHPDGSLHWVSTRCVPVRNEQGVVIGLAGVSSDITERRRAEEWLRFQAQVLRQTHDAIIACDLEGRITFWNEAAERDTGYTADEVCGQNVTLLGGPEDHAHFEQHIRKPLLEQGSLQREISCRRKNGTRYWGHINIATMRTSEGQVAGYVATLIDIDEQRRAARAVAKEKQLLRDVLDSMGMYVALCDLDGRIVEMGRMTIDALQQTREETVGTLCWEHKVWDKTPESQRQLREAFPMVRAGQTIRFDARVQRYNGTIATVDVSLSPLRDRHGNVTHVVATGVDITERVEAEEKIRLHREELARMLEIARFGEFASGIAHELNQPLMAIAGYAERLRIVAEKDSAVGNETLRRTTRKLAEQAVRAGEIVKSLRGLARRIPERQTFAINPIIERAINSVAVEARRARVCIERRLAEGLSSVEGDPVQIEQVAINLLRNAIDAVAVQPESDRRIVVETSAPAPSQIEVRVTDTGPGIAGDLRDRVFTPFYSTKAHGLGVGLAICRSIVDAHRGCLELDESAAQGASFRFTLPVHEES